jgi:YbgC/YbaW family acyl-CoA thioester hydrolase
MPARRFTREELLLFPAGFVHALTVRFQDIDAAGIVFFPRIFEYCHDAYVAFLAACGEPLPAALKTQAWAGPLIHAEADFLRPLRFGDELRVLIVCGELSGSTLSLGYRLVAGEAEPAQAPVIAVAQTAHAFVAPATFQRTPPPQRISEGVARLGAPP